MPADILVRLRPHLGRLFLLVAAVGGALAVAGSFMTWGEVQIPFFDTIELDGFDDGRDGRLSLSLGLATVLAAAIGARKRLRLASATGITLLGSAIVAVAVADMFQLDDQRKILDQISFFSQPLSDIVSTKLGVGLYLVAAGGSLAAIGGLGALLTATVTAKTARSRPEGH